MDSTPLSLFKKKLFFIYWYDNKKIDICKKLSINQISWYLFETTIKKIKKNYDDKYKINKILKNEIKKKNKLECRIKKKGKSVWN
jgi:hypothetical protein